MYQSQNIRSAITTTAAAAAAAAQSDIKYIQIDSNNFNNFNDHEFACGGVKNYYPNQVYIEQQQQQQQQPEEFQQRQQQQQLYLVRNDNDARLSRATQNGNDETSVAFAFDQIGAVINGEEFSEFQDYKRDLLQQQQQQPQQQRSLQLTREPTTQEQKHQQQQQRRRLQHCLNEAASIAQNQQQVNSFRAAQSLSKINNNNNNNNNNSIGNPSAESCLKAQQGREEDRIRFVEKFANVSGAAASIGQPQQSPLAEQQQQQQVNANQGQQLQYQQINQQYQQLKETIYRETRAFFYDDYQPASSGKQATEEAEEEEEEKEANDEIEERSMAANNQQQLHEQQLQFKQGNNNGTNNYGNGLYASIYDDDSMKQQQQDRPFVEIVEQPAKCSLRFRYKCEGRSAGSLPGVNSSADNKTYPSIRIHNYTGRAVVVISCVTKEAPYLAHPHNIVGKEGCKKGICTVVLANNEPDAIRSFSSLGIQCVKRKDIEESLTLRESINVDPYRNGFAHKLQASNIDLNAVRLCFQVFVEGSTANKCDVPLAPVVSEPIHDKKAMSDLVITKLSHCSAPASGGREVILLCDRISRDDIQIRFYEERPDGKLIWETYTELASTDVHKQVAICFRTPKYFNEHIQQPVTVRIQLKRLSDNQFSEPRMFQFLPSESDEEIISRKRQKIQWVNQIQNHHHQHHHQQQQHLNQAIHQQQQQQHHNQHHHQTSHQQHPAGSNIIQGQHRLQPPPPAQHRAQASSSRAGQQAAGAAAAAHQQGGVSPAAGYSTATTTTSNQTNQNQPPNQQQQLPKQRSVIHESDSLYRHQQQQQQQQQPAGRGSASPQSRIASPAAPNECDFSQQPQVVAVVPAPATNTMIDGRALHQGTSPTPLAQTTPTHHHQHPHQHHNRNNNNTSNQPTQMHEQDNINYMIEQQQQQQQNLVVRREIIDIDGKVMRLVDRPSQQQQSLQQQQQQANNQASNGIARNGQGAASRDESATAALAPSNAADQQEANSKLAGPLASSLDRIDTAELMRDMTFNSNIMDLNLGSSLSIHLNGGGGGGSNSSNQTNYNAPP